MKKILVAASLAVMVVSMALPARAAVNVAVAGPAATLTNFATPVVVLAQAGPATFIQADPTAPHDITELPENKTPAQVSNGQYAPKFKSPKGAPQGTYDIEFNGTLEAGEYRFVCLIHPDTMVGTAVVV